jgi:hypothetical protein
LVAVAAVRWTNRRRNIINLIRDNDDTIVRKQLLGGALLETTPTISNTNEWCEAM